MKPGGAVQEMARVQGVKPLGGGAYLMLLHAPGVAAAAAPGQFLHVQCTPPTAVPASSPSPSPPPPPSPPDHSRPCSAGTGPLQEILDPLLRRPISFHRVSPGRGEIELLFSVVGRGTGLLSQAHEGDMLDVLGPLGRGFPAPDHQPVREAPEVWLVGGGVGVAPLLAAAEELARAGGAGPGCAKLFAGASTARQLLRLREFEATCPEVRVATEDGSAGDRGLVTDIVAAALPAPPGTVCFACGPRPMLGRLARLLEPARVRCFVSMEARLACGVGSCHGCAVPARNAARVTGRSEGAHVYRLVCVDGPVFDSLEVELD